jgi:hypothetical protein
MGSHNLEWAEYNRRSSVRLHSLFVGSPTGLKLQSTDVCRIQNCKKCRLSHGALDDVGNVYSRAPPDRHTGLLHFNSQLAYCYRSSNNLNVGGLRVQRLPDCVPVSIGLLCRSAQIAKYDERGP